MDPRSPHPLHDTVRLALPFGMLKPTEQVVIAVEDDATAQRLAVALKQEGVREPILRITAIEMNEQLEEWLEAHGIADPGSEGALMQRYQVLAAAGCGWVVVLAPDPVAEQRIAEVARRFAARFANRHNPLTVEDLLS
jgi:alkanesulfonate monooxygenase SsuD/methylene tetrahydromethanopterin reductase-like flavin-dependent oxidoreductase (luciferase family)